MLPENTKNQSLTFPNQTKESLEEAPPPLKSKVPLITISELLSQTLRIYKKRARVLWLLLAIPGGLAVFGSVISEINPLLPQALSMVLGVLVLPLSLAAFLGGLWAGLSLVFAIKDEIGFKEALSRAWHKLLAYLWLSILSFLVIAGGTFLFVIPGIIFGIWFAFAAYVLVSEDLKGREALLKSKAYVQGYWWPVLGRFLLIGLLLAALVSLFNGIVFIGIFGLRLIVGSQPLVSQILTMFITALIQFFSTVLLAPISAIYSFLLYQDIKTKKAGLVFEATKKAKRALVLWASWTFMAASLIIVMLVTIVYLTLSSGADWAQGFRDVIREAHQLEILERLDLYYQQHQSYPDVLPALEQESLRLNDDTGFGVPRDPKTKNNYYYRAQEGGQNFELCLDFERKARECFDKDDIQKLPYKQPSQPSAGKSSLAQTNSLWSKFVLNKAQWFSALIGVKSLLPR